MSLGHDLVKFSDDQAFLSERERKEEFVTEGEYTEGHCIWSARIRRFFWSVFSLIRTKCEQIWSIFLYSVQMRENTDQKNSEYGHFSRTGCLVYSAWSELDILHLWHFLFCFCFLLLRNLQILNIFRLYRFIKIRLKGLLW